MYPINHMHRTSKITPNTSISYPLKEKEGYISAFKQILEKEEQKLQFSKHAALRLQQRNIYLSQEQLNKLEEGVEKATKKGIKDSLILMDNMAFVINIKNKTVITAFECSQNQETVFTNIDGALIL